jgi:tetratricopeptide (TPR) repeat protein
MADYTKAIELNPDYVLVYVHRADVYEKKGDRAAALADRVKVTTLLLQPKTADEYNSRAWAYFKAGKAAEALPDAMRSLEVAAERYQYSRHRGHIFEALGRREEAIADFRLALLKKRGHAEQQGRTHSARCDP